MQPEIQRTSRAMGALEKTVESLSAELRQIGIDFRTLQIEFRWFRNIMITLYLTIIAPLVVAIFMNLVSRK